MTPTTTSPSAFSRARRPAMHPAKRLRGFLALPGEIRNQIYTYYFDREHHCQVAAKSSQLGERKPRTVKLRSGLSRWQDNAEPGASTNNGPLPTVLRFSRQLGKYSIVQGLQTNWLTSPYALSLVCKQVYLETAAFLYTRTVFAFDAPKRMRRFLSVVPSASLQQMTRLHLHYNTYGHPERSDDQIWQDKHSQSWSSVCRVASKQLTGLQELQVWVQIHDSAPKFSLREKWVQPLLQFRRLTSRQPRMNHGGGGGGGGGDDAASPTPMALDTVKVHICTRWSRDPLAMSLNNHGLAQASTELHVLYGQAVSLAIKGAKEQEAMAAFNAAWQGKYKLWNHHLQFARTGW